MSEPAWPRKTREMHSHHFDSTVWNEFKFRDDDIIVSTYGKSGTTWTQQIVGQLVFEGAENVPIHALSPWLDMRIPPADMKLSLLEAQTHRRIIKTHLPVDALVFSPKAKYIYIARDGRDVLWSLYNHHSAANEVWYQALNETPGRVGPKIERPDPDIRRYFRTWLEQDGFPFWSFWDNSRSWWAIRNLPNVKFVHFTNLKADLRGEIESMAKFLGIAVRGSVMDRIVHHCSFDYMRANAAQTAPLGGSIFEGGGESFIYKGVNGCWRDVLSAEESTAYEAKALAELGPDCAGWLATGKGL
jgi:aryl sulfotransferase